MKQKQKLRKKMDMSFEGGFVVLERLTSAQSVGEVKSVKGGGRLDQLDRGEVGRGEQRGYERQR
ncbi:unnamed protein product [Prunus armeniaca]